MGWVGVVCTPYNGLYAPEWGAFVRFQVYQRVGKFVISLCKKDAPRDNMYLIAVKNSVEKAFWFCEIVIFQIHCLYSS